MEAGERLDKHRNLCDRRTDDSSVVGYFLDLIILLFGKVTKLKLKIKHESSLLFLLIFNRSGSFTNILFKTTVTK